MCKNIRRNFRFKFHHLGIFKSHLYQVRIIRPVSERFVPELLLISAGFDAHWSDPLAGLQLSTHGYFALGRALIEIADNICSGRIIFMLEGGYDLDKLAESVVAHISVLLGET